MILGWLRSAPDSLSKNEGEPETNTVLGESEHQAVENASSTGANSTGQTLVSGS
jgi:hypothetical protein